MIDNKLDTISIKFGKDIDKHFGQFVWQSSIVRSNLSDKFLISICLCTQKIEIRDAIIRYMQIVYNLDNAIVELDEDNFYCIKYVSLTEEDILKFDVYYRMIMGNSGKL